MLEAKLNSGRNEEDPAGQDSGLEGAPGPWQAPKAPGPITATTPLPGSKSLTNRELILAALADGPGTLRAPLHSRDSDLMVDGLRALGVTIDATGSGPFGPDLRITPSDELTGSTSVACGLAGTVMRFLPPVAALALGPVAFDGDPYARKRPMRPVLNALRALGADIADEGRGALPFTVHGAGSLRGGRVELDASLSSQFVSGLLLSAPLFDEGVHVVHTGDRLPSVPHIEMTIAALQARGVEAASPATGEWRVGPGPISARDVTIEPDLSNAAPFLAAALAAGGSVTVPNWPATTTQVGDHLRELLPVFGATAVLDGDRLTVASDGTLNGVELHVPNAGELAPTLVGLAALAAHGTGAGDGQPSRITGIGHIRHHETDRIAALVAEITRLGGRAVELDDGIEILPATLHGGLWGAYADHRMATTGALIGLRVPGVEVDDIECTSKTLPQFVALWAAMLGLPSASDADSAGTVGGLHSGGLRGGAAGTLGFGTAGIGATGFGTLGIDATGFGTVGFEAPDLEAPDLEAPDLDSVDFESTTDSPEAG